MGLDKDIKMELHWDWRHTSVLEQINMIPTRKWACELDLNIQISWVWFWNMDVDNLRMELQWDWTYTGMNCCCLIEEANLPVDKIAHFWYAGWATMQKTILSGFVHVLENLESHGILFVSFPDLESHGKLNHRKKIIMSRSLLCIIIDKNFTECIWIMNNN